MIVISDTSPLTALLGVGAADILPKLFTEVVIPEAVRDELRASPLWKTKPKPGNTPRLWTPAKRKPSN